EPPHHAADSPVQRAPVDEQERAHQAAVLLRPRLAGASVVRPCTTLRIPDARNRNHCNRRVAYYGTTQPSGCGCGPPFTAPRNVGRVTQAVDPSALQREGEAMA